MGAKASAVDSGTVQLSTWDDGAPGEVVHTFLSVREARSLAAQLVVAAGGRDLEKRMGAVVDDVREGVELARQTQETLQSAARIANGAQRFLRKLNKR